MIVGLDVTLEKYRCIVELTVYWIKVKSIPEVV